MRECVCERCSEFWILDGAALRTAMAAQAPIDVRTMAMIMKRIRKERAQANLRVVSLAR